MITWSSIRILSVFAAVAADWVNLSSSVLGLVFPLGWLCESINEVASQRIASLSSTLISIRHVFSPPEEMRILLITLADEFIKIAQHSSVLLSPKTGCI